MLLTKSVPAVSTAVLLLLPSLAAAVCRNFTVQRTYIDSIDSFSSAAAVPLENLICPSANTSGCTFPRKEYLVTAPRSLNFTTSYLSDQEVYAAADSVMAAAAAAAGNFTSPGFYDRACKISSELPISGVNGRPIPNSVPNYLTLAAGQNRTLYYVPFQYVIFGTLGFCSNSSLNQLPVRIAAPLWNASALPMIPGTWTAITANVSRAATAVGSSSPAQVTTSGAAVGIGATVWSAAAVTFTAAVFSWLL